MFNVGSILLGVGAWLFAVPAITSAKAAGAHRSAVVSFGLCAIALVLQICEINGLVLMGDFAAIEDTICARVIAAVVLVSVTSVLNIVSLLKVRR